MPSDRRKRLEALPGWSWNLRSDKWEDGFRYLKEFVSRYGHCRVVQTYKTSDGYRLGVWVIKQRQMKNTMPSDRRKRLEELSGWSWDAISEKWENGFLYLKQFLEQNGHCQVPYEYHTEDGYPLGSWVGVQRANKDAMERDRRKRLEELSGWSWNIFDDRWEDGFSHLKEFVERNGHCRVPKSYMCEDGYRLGGWAAVQRRTKDTIDLDRRKRLEELPRWSWDPWDPYSDQWEENFSRLKQFSDREGHCRVPSRYKTDDGYRLGYWVQDQRRARGLEPNRRQRLEALPAWTWKIGK